MGLASMAIKFNPPGFFSSHANWQSISLSIASIAWRKELLLTPTVRFFFLARTFTGKTQDKRILKRLRTFCQQPCYSSLSMSIFAGQEIKLRQEQRFYGFSFGRRERVIKLCYLTKLGKQFVRKVHQRKKTITTNVL